MAILFPYFELAAALFILFMAFESMSRYSNNRVGRFFARLALIAFLSAIFEYSVRIAMTMELAAHIHRLTGLTWSLLFPAFTYFCVLFTGNERSLKKTSSRLIFFSPAIISAALFLFTNVMITRYEIWSIGVIYQPSPWYWYYALVNFGYILLGITILLRHARITPQKEVKKQALVIALGTGLALLLAGVTDEVIPLILGQRIFWPTAIFSLALMQAFVFYAMRHYSLFSVSPGMVADVIIETMPDSLVVTDLGGRILLLNEEAHKYFHADKEEILGKNIKDLFLDKDKFYQLYEIVVNKGQEIERFETKLCDPKGQCLPSYINANVCRDATGTLLSIIFVLRDIRG
ncbi:MAG: PAS domain-containing protein [bacterium]